MLAGLLVGGLSLFVARARVRKLFAVASVAISVGADHAVRGGHHLG
jgi:hypothetical protein